MKIQAEIWLQDAIEGKELTTEQRRHVVAWIMATGSYTNAEMAQLFKVNERTITTDRTKIRELMADSIKEEDIGLILSDLRMTFEEAIRRTQKAIKKAKPGTRTYLDYVNNIPKLQTEYTKVMQDLGYFPKSLGTLQVDKFEFKANVGLQVGEKRDLNMFKDPPTIDGEVVEVKAITDGKDSSSETAGSTPEIIGATQESNNESSNSGSPASA